MSAERHLHHTHPCGRSPRLPRPCTHTDILLSQITASMSAGSFAGAIAAGFISDRLGRRLALMIASAIWIVGAAVQCSAQSVAHLIAGRVISGLAIGITSSQCCVYLAELAPARIRGRIVGIQQWSIEWGILIMYLVRCVSFWSQARYKIADAQKLRMRAGGLRSFCFPYRMGHSSYSWPDPRNIFDLLPRIASLARRTRSLGRVP
jgi:MFS family permease